MTTWSIAYELILDLICSNSNLTLLTKDVDADVKFSHQIVLLRQFIMKTMKENFQVTLVRKRRDLKIGIFSYDSCSIDEYLYFYTNRYRLEIFLPIHTNPLPAHNRSWSQPPMTPNVQFKEKHL